MVAALATSPLKCHWSVTATANFVPLVSTATQVIALSMGCSDTNGGFVVALDLATGKQLWRTKTLPPDVMDFLRATPTGAGSGVVVLGEDDGHVAGRDVATGRVLWRHSGLPVADGADIAVIADGARARSPLLVVDRKTGRERWRVSPAAHNSRAFPAVAAGSGVIAVSVEGETVGYAAHTGAKRWTIPIGPASDTTSVRIIDGVVSGVTGHGNTADAGATHAYDVNTGRAVWTSPAFPAETAQPTAHNLYVAFPHTLAALDPHTGRIRWRHDITEPGFASPGPGSVVLAAQGLTEGIDATTGTVMWKATDNALAAAAGHRPANEAPAGIVPENHALLLSYGQCPGGE